MKPTILRIKLSGMHCTSCALNIDMALEDLPGVTEANTDYLKQETTTAYFPDKIEPKKIIEEITGLGYKAEIIK